MTGKRVRITKGFGLFKGQTGLVIGHTSDLAQFLVKMPNGEEIDPFVPTHECAECEFVGKKKRHVITSMLMECFVWTFANCAGETYREAHEFEPRVQVISKSKELGVVEREIGQCIHCGVLEDEVTF